MASNPQFRLVETDDPSFSSFFRNYSNGYTLTGVTDINNDGEFEILYDYYSGGYSAGYYYKNSQNEWAQKSFSFDSNFSYGSRHSVQLIDRFSSRPGEKALVVGNTNGTIDYYLQEPSKKWIKQNTETANPFSNIELLHADGGNQTNLSLQFVDLDRDTYRDLIVTGNHTIAHYEEHSPGNWVKIRDIFNMRSYDSNTNETYSTFSDFDGDGDVDAAIFSDGNFYYFRQNSYSSWSQFTGSNSPFYQTNLPGDQAVSSNYNIPIALDIDNDGDNDLIFSSSGSSGVRIYENLRYDYDIAFKQMTSTTDNPDLQVFRGLGIYDLTQFIDYDNDGKLEALNGHNNGYIYYNDLNNDTGAWNGLSNTGRGFSHLDVGYESRPYMINDNQMIVASSSSSRSWVNSNITLYNSVLNSSTGEYTWEQQSTADNPFSHVYISRHYAPVFADIDGDGDLDLTVRNGSYIDYYKQESPTQWVKQSGNYFSGVSLSGHHVLGDFDNDGSIDILVNNQFYRKEGSSWVAFSSSEASSLYASTGSAPVVHDLDGDGDLDVFYNSSYIYENTLYDPNDAIKVTRHAAKRIDMNNSSHTINLDNYFSDADRGNLTYTIKDQPDFVVLDDNIISFPGGDRSDLGAHSLQVTATNSARFSTQQAVNIYVTDYKYNSAPESFSPPLHLSFDTQHSWSVYMNEFFSDPGDDLSFTISEFTVSARVSGDRLYLETDNTAPGDYKGYITAQDSFGASATYTYSFTVAAENDAPGAVYYKLFTAKEDGRIGYFDLYEIFPDEENDDLEFTVYDSHYSHVDGFSITEIGDGLYTFKATEEYSNWFYVRVSAREKDTVEHHSAYTTLTFSITDPINDTPTAEYETLTATVTEDADFSYSVTSHFGFNDEESGTSLTYSITGDDIPTGIDISSSSGNITIDDSYTNHNAFGSDNRNVITVTASDGNSHVSSTLILAMSHVNDNPTAIRSTLPQEIAEGASYSFNFLEEFGFSDEEGGQFSYTVNLYDVNGNAIAIEDSPFSVEGSFIKGEPKNGDVGSYKFSITANDTGRDDSNQYESVKSVSGTLNLQVNNGNDAPYINPDKLAIMQGKAAYELTTHANGTMIMDLNEYFKDIDLAYGDELSFTITTNDATTAQLLGTVQGITKNTLTSTTSYHEFKVTQTTDSQTTQNQLIFNPLDSTTGNLSFAIKAQDDGQFGGPILTSDVLNFKLSVVDEYRWSFGDEALVINSPSRGEDKRADIVASLDDDVSFEGLSWERQGNNIVVQIVTGTEDGETTTNVATVNDAFRSYGPQRFIVKQGDKEEKLYLNFGYGGSQGPTSNLTAYADISGTYKEVIMPAQDLSTSVEIAAGTSVNAEYHIYSRELSTGSDVLTGNNGRDFFYILGEGNNDINGAAGSDTVIYVNPKSNLNITLDSGSHLSRGVYSDILTSIENITIVGSSGNINTLTGTTGANRIEGGDGGDTIIGNGGADQLIGGGGRDYITVTGSEILADGSESYGDNDNEHRDVLRFASDDTVTNVEVDYLLDAGGKFINFEEMDLAADGKNFIVKLDKDSIMEIFGGNVAVSGRANGATKDTIILRDFADWTRTEEDGIIKYTYGTEATITMQDDNVNVIEPITAVTHTINIDSTDNPDTPHSDFKFVDNGDAAQVVLDFNPLRGDVLLFKDADTVSPLQIKEELPQFLNSWWFLPGAGLRLNSGNFGTSEASDVFIQPAEGADISGIAPRFPGTPLNTDAWNDLVEALGGADAFEFM